MKKRGLAIVLAIMMMTAMTAGCSSKKSDTAAETPQTTVTDENTQTDNNGSDTADLEEKEITVWGWDKNFNGYALEEADKLYDGAKVNFVEMAKADALQKLHTVLASGVTDELPDIVLISDLAAQGYLMSYPEAFKPMDEVINYSDFAGYKKAAVSYDNVGYGVPFDTGVTGLFYRTDYIEEAGYTKEDMQDLTWDEYFQLGEKLKEKGHLLQTYNPNDISEFQIMLQSAGTWYTDDEGKANFENNAALKECYSIFNRFNQSDIVKLVSDWTEFAGAINGGEVACVIRGSWISSTVMAAADQSGKWAVAPIPKLSVEGATNCSNQGGSSWFVLNKSANAELAADFLAKTFAGNKDLYNTLLEQKNIVGTYLPASIVPAYGTAQEFYGGQKVNSDLAGWLEQVPVVNTGAFTTEAQAALTGVTPKILEGADLDECLKEATAQFEQSIQ
jgi:lactose/L-arabinose transport system substrate-binding protein